MKKIFIAVSKTENGKHFAFVETIKTGENILNYIQRHKTADIFHLCESKKEAEETIYFWNKQYHKNGTFLYDFLTEGI